MTDDYKSIVNKTDIREIKLIDGSTIMCEVISEDEEMMMVTDAHLIDLDLDHGGIALMPWFIGTEQKSLELYHNKIVASVSVSPTVKVSYIKHLLKHKVINMDPNNEFFMDMNPSEDDMVH